MKAKNKPSAPKAKVKVLYQYLNGRWYAFADYGDEIFFGQVPVQQTNANSKSAAKDSEKPASKARRKAPSKAA